jgi:hypothetical protein
MTNNFINVTSIESVMFLRYGLPCLALGRADTPMWLYFQNNVIKGGTKYSNFNFISIFTNDDVVI